MWVSFVVITPPTSRSHIQAPAPVKARAASSRAPVSPGASIRAETVSSSRLLCDTAPTVTLSTPMAGVGRGLAFLSMASVLARVTPTSTSRPRPRRRPLTLSPSAQWPPPSRLWSQQTVTGTEDTPGLEEDITEIMTPPSSWRTSGTSQAPGVILRVTEWAPLVPEVRQRKMEME